MLFIYNSIAYFLMKHKDNPLSPKVNKHNRDSIHFMDQLACTLSKKLQLQKPCEDPINKPHSSTRTNRIYTRQKSQLTSRKQTHHSFYKRDFNSGIEQQPILQSKHFRASDLKNNNFNIKLSKSLHKKDNITTINFPQSASKQVNSTKNKLSLDAFVSLHQIKSFFQQTHLTSESSSFQIHNMFQQFLQLKQLFVRNPVMKKYKNCVYFGEPIQQKYSYRGFLYFWKGKIYYGQLFNQKKNGKGKQVNWEDNSLYEGTFIDGKKTGFFVIEKVGEKYQGQLLQGKYHGKGKLTTHLSQYIGDFQNGLRHGRGQQLFFNSKLTIKGTFNQGIFSNELPGQKCLKKQQQELAKPQSPFSKIRYKALPEKQTDKYAINLQQFSFSLEEQSSPTQIDSNLRNYKYQNPQQQCNNNFRTFRKSYNLGARRQY